MSARTQAHLWVAQRVTAVVLALCVAVHLATIIYATRAGLSAAAILGRTQGSMGWSAFYTLFVFAAAIHGAIGLRTVMIEWLGLKSPAAGWICALVGLFLLVLGMRAVIAVGGAA